MRFEIKDINDKEWQALDFLLEDVERGHLSEKFLLKDETFLHMLSAVKFNANNFKEVPPFISGSELCKKYCQQVNPNVIEIINGNKLSKIEVYNKYLGFDLNEERLHTGEGSMFREKSQREKAAYMVGKVLKDDNEFWHKVIIDLGEMTDEEWDLIQKVVEKLK